MRRGTFLALCALVPALTATILLIPRLKPVPRLHAYVGLELVLSALMFGAWAAWPEETGSRRCALASGVAARLIAAVTPAFPSTDTARYLWDGHVALAGIDPYRVVPNVARALVAPWPSWAYAGDIPTIYPPGSLLLFAIAAAFGRALAAWVWKLLVLAASLELLALIDWTLRTEKLERHLPLVALSPLLVLEGGVGGHVDVFSALAVAATIWWLSRGRSARAGAALGLGVLAKLLPGLLWFPLGLSPGRRCASRFSRGFIAAVAGGFGIAWLLGFHPPGSLFIFLKRWPNASPLFAGATALWSRAGANWAAGATALVAGAAGVWMARRGLHIEGAIVTLSGPLLAGPVLFPWYALPLVPLAALRPSAWALGFITTVLLLYEFEAGLEQAIHWSLPSWPLWAIAMAVAAGLAIDGLSRRQPPASWLTTPRHSSPREAS